MNATHTICIDPGHGMGNVKAGRYDPGTESSGVTEAGIVMEWANELRDILRQGGHTVIRTRKDASDPAPVAKRASVAKGYGCEIFLSLHCNAANGAAHGTETFYRGAGNAALAKAINGAVASILGTRDRGIKTESESQRSSLAVLNFPRAVLLEIGFIDHAGDCALMTTPAKRKAACLAIAEVLLAAI